MNRKYYKCLVFVNTGSLTVESTQFNLFPVPFPSPIILALVCMHAYTYVRMYACMYVCMHIQYEHTNEWIMEGPLLQCMYI